MGSAKAPLPPAPVLNPPPATAPAEVVERGRETFSRHCAMCHETPGANRGLFPDLRYSAALHSDKVFNAIVLDGALQAKGMASFKQTLKPDDTYAIRAYLITRAHAAKAGVGR